MRKTFSLPVAATAAGGGVTPPPADTVDNIEHSVRFNSADSARLNRTPSSAGNRRTWTWSGWAKRSKLGSTYLEGLFTAGTSNANINPIYFGYSSADTIAVFYYANSLVYHVETSTVFRDPSAWYHVLVAFDSTQATASDRIKIYVNGTEQTSFSVSSYPSQNLEGWINNTDPHGIGGAYATSGSYNGYLANVHFVDGQALTPSSFGFTDSSGVWQPKSYSGSYGTNGFHLDFADTSSATALGNDVSGNNNDFTPSGLVAGPAYTANSFSTEFDGTGDYLSIPSSTDLQFGTGDWTIEHWVYIPSGTSMLSYWRSSVGVSGDSNTVNAATIYFGSGQSDSSVISEPAFIGPSNAYRLYSGVDIRGKWTHVAVTKASNTVRLFVDGILKASQSDSNNYNATGNTLIGVSNLSQNNYFLGKISNVRVIKGRALYTAAFTPPSTALTATDDTVLLTCQDATVRDNSNIGHDVQPAGDVAVVNEGPFNGYSGSFDGNGDRLSVAASTDFDIGSAKTWECWFKLNTVSANKLLFGSLNNHWLSISYTGLGGAANKVGFSAWDGSNWNTINSTTSIAAGSWYHVAATWDGTYSKLYLNGVLEATSPDLSAKTWASNNGNPYEISGYSGDAASSIDGVISNLRITDSVVYTADFTPPTADLTTTSQGATASNVKLLTCQNSTFIDNSPSAHTITITGDAYPVSVNPHTDKYSVTFDGTGDYLTVPSSTEFDFGSGDWTLECWIKYTTNADYGLINRSNGAAASNSAWILYLTNGAPSLYTTSSTGWTNNIVPSATYNDGKWHHIAATRNGSDLYLYVDGTQVGTTTAPTIPVSTRNVEIGTQDGSYTFNGQISNLRLTKGQALYTSNFLPSKEDLTTTSQGATASNVKLLTCQSYKIQDNSDSPLTITVNGDAKPSTDAPFVTSGAGSFDGTGDYLATASDADFNFGTGAFSVEMWMYPTASPATYDGILFGNNPSTTGIFWAMRSGNLDFINQGDSYTLLQTTYPTLNRWTHVAVCRDSSGTIRLFKDGVLEDSATNNTDNYSQTEFHIGGQAAYGPFTGYLSNFRYSKGYARYTAAFTPPTEDFDPTDQDTTFLALQGNNLDDLSGNDHAVTANGDAATSTVSPFEPVDGSDAMLDSPTNYGSGDTVRGNYCTLNPLNKAANGGSTNGNFEYLSSGGNPNGITGTMAVSSGKWLYESIATNNAYSSGNPVYQAGFIKLDDWDGVFGSPMWTTTSFYGYSYREGNKSINGTSTSFATGAAIGDVIGFALDLDAGELEIYKNGTSLGVLATGLSGTFIPCVESRIGSYSGQAATVNFGQQPFKYPVAGYKAWCSTNLPTPAVADGSTAMDVVTYTGNGGTQTISTPNLSPDLIWLKRRNTTGQHVLTDIVRGTNSQLYSSSTNSEGSDTTVVTAFNSAGFELGSGPVSFGNTNTLNSTYVGWTWDAGSSTVSNTDGTITSQVRANPTAGVSICTFSVTTANSISTFGHSLAASPELVIVKPRNGTHNWAVYHNSTGLQERLQLNSTAASYDYGYDVWSSNNSTVGVYSSILAAPNTALDCVAYAFAPVEGFSAFGSYVGNSSSTDGPFVYTGMRPKWIMIKDITTTGGSWVIYDTERDTDNLSTQRLAAHSATQENDNSVVSNSTTVGFDILSNGFKLRIAGLNHNSSGDTYIYAAFAEHPFKTSRAR